MTDNEQKINELLKQLEFISQRQEYFAREINELRKELSILAASPSFTPVENEGGSKAAQPVIPQFTEVKTEPVKPVLPVQPKYISEARKKYVDNKIGVSPKIKTDIEKFIGENLINKIGIAITIIGVAIGAKYSIEHDLISPLTRIILGYLMGLGLLGFGIKLKKNYEGFSAVLVSGAIAIMYFITYAAYSFYDLIPQLLAFALMFIFTAFAVVAAIQYNKQIIAIIGLVGAYAVPFLLSNASGKIEVLFTYVAIINVGILFISFKKYWKPLYFSSFLITWLIYYAWFTKHYSASLYFTLAFVFLTIYFVIFYCTFLAFKLIKKDKFEDADIGLLLVNSFIFYGLGYSILSSHETGRQLLGLYTLCNAIVHFIAGTIIYRQKLADRNLFFLVTGLVLVFITIAIPVQLDGHWVTLLWVGGAALLFWIGRTKKVVIYEMMSYPLMLLAFISIIQDWLMMYKTYDPQFPATRIMPLLNINFLSSVIFISLFVFIHYLNNSAKYVSQVRNKLLYSIVNFGIPAILLIAVYFSFRMEIGNYFYQLSSDAVIVVKKAGQAYRESYPDNDLINFRNIWLINYTLLFFSILAYVNIVKLKNRTLGLINILFGVIAIIAFLTMGLLFLSELKESYLNNELPRYFRRSYFNIGIRYISYAFVILMLNFIYRYTRQEFLKPLPVHAKVAFDLLLYISILWIASSELITWMSLMKFSQSYKLGLSILWGVYALLLIVIGIWKKKKHLRVGAIALFAVTLIKLFFYDIADLDTIAKTIVFVALGILLLIISFLYNKYKTLISGENES